MDQETTWIPRRGRFAGKLETPGSVVLEGRLEGSIVSGERVTVTQSGVAVAEINGRRVEVSGVVVGNVTADEAIAVLAGARVVGDLRAPEVMVDSGATLEGRVDRIAAAPPSSTRQTLQQIVQPLVKPGPEAEPPPRRTPQPPRLAGRVRMNPKRP